MKPIEPILTAGLFPALHAELMALVSRLTAAEWARPTTATLWTVRDVAAHLLDGDVRRLSAQRDRWPPPPPPAPIVAHADLVAYLDQLNADWVRAARRIAPALLVDFLAVTGPQVAALVAGLDPFGPALYPVAWAGEAQSENWLDVGREYTERWHHQQQIRQAVGAPDLTGPSWLRPVIDVSVRALPRAYRDVPAEAGQAVTVRITGAAGGSWTLLRDADRWRLMTGEAPRPLARVSLSEDTAWRLFFGVPPRDRRAELAIEGHEPTGVAILNALAIMG